TLASFAYGYDGVGNRTRVVEANGDRVSWTYDATYQLTHEQRSGANAYDVTHAYDLAGNRTLVIDGRARTTSTFDAANQLLSARGAGGTTPCGCDASGNLVNVTAPGGGRTTYTWDFEDRPTKVLLASGLRNTFVYDGDSRRVRREDSTGVLKGVWDGEDL